MTSYADSSALVKRYFDEPGADAVRALQTVVISSLAAVEVSSAIWRRQRMGELPAADASVLARVAQGELTGGDLHLIVLPPTGRVVDRAAGLTGTAGLRAYDAIQLATALEARDAYPDCTGFVCFDEGLAAAAAAHGFDLVPGA